ncbi:MAG: sulfotransferase [Candidatus Melainabacteria bacterium]|nr:sulfotransferase [Candidatus Melainabacteria bacterium]
MSSFQIPILLSEKTRFVRELTVREISRLDERRRTINLEEVEEPVSEPKFNTSTVLIAIKSGITRWAENTTIPRHLNYVLQQSSFWIRPSLRNKLLSPIFVLGSGHSGTSIMLKILSNHSQIYAVEGESDCFIWNGLVSKLRCFSSWNNLTLNAGASRWAEKTPKHLWYINDVFNYFPNAKVIIMLRDGRDVALSQAATWGNFEKSAQRWVTECAVVQQHLSHANVALVKYEDLVTNSTDTLKRVFEFIGEEFEPEVVHTERIQQKWYSPELEKPDIVNRSTHTQYRNWQINQPLADFSNKWVTHMTTEEKETFKSVAGALLIELGYARDLNW